MYIIYFVYQIAAPNNSAPNDTAKPSYAPEPVLVANAFAPVEPPRSGFGPGEQLLRRFFAAQGGLAGELDANEVRGGLPAPPQGHHEAGGRVPAGPEAARAAVRPERNCEADHLQVRERQALPEAPRLSVVAAGRGDTKVQVGTRVVRL